MLFKQCCRSASNYADKNTDPLSLFDADQDRNSYFKADPDPHQSDAILQLPVYRPSTTP